jgi:hypothetical protein
MQGPNCGTAEPALPIDRLPNKTAPPANCDNVKSSLERKIFPDGNTLGYGRRSGNVTPGKLPSPDPRLSCAAFEGAGFLCYPGFRSELVAQLVEQRPFKAWVLGSNPSGLTMRESHYPGPPTRPVLAWRGGKAWVLGSNPSGLTMRESHDPGPRHARFWRGGAVRRGSWVRIPAGSPGQSRAPESALIVKCTAGTARSRSAAVSGVISRCGMPSISKPTMYLRTVAERSRGG